MSSGTNWDAIRAAYVTGSVSQAELCREYGVSARQVAEHSRTENWVEQRKAYRSKTAAKAINRASDKDAAVLGSLLRSVTRLSRQVERGLEDDYQLFRHLIMVGGGHEPMDTEERIYNKMDADALRKMSGAIKELTAAARDLLGVRSVQQQEEYMLSLRRLALEEAKSGMSDGDEDGMTGVILMPDVADDAAYNMDAGDASGSSPAEDGGQDGG